MEILYMSMNPEWKRRVEKWIEALEKLVYVPIGEIEFSGFVTKEQLTVSEALKKKFGKMPEGTAWGAKWEYGWFRGTVKIPERLSGKRIAAKVNIGGEAAIMLNGQDKGSNTFCNWGANDIGHKEITLTRKASGREKFEILVESYAGHGKRTAGGGPCPHNIQVVPEPEKTQVVVGSSSFGIWEEEVYQLLIDVKTLYGLRESMMDTEALRFAEIDDALKEFTLVVDPELLHDEMMKTVRQGRKILKPVLDAVNGSSAPLMTCFGHSHIDVAWLWPLQETERKCSRTFASQLALMDEYPEYKFLQAQPHLYWMVQKKYPELYERIKKAVKKGQWLVEGGMWVEPDTNITGGESLIRQFIYGKRFFKEEFGVDSELMWLPDVFGYSGALPQIMKGCGIKYFSTQKIFWTYNGGDPFPYNIFWWEGIDGTKVLSYMHNNYSSQTDPESIAKRWTERVQKDAFHKGRLQPFGYGDGGGGPTRDHLEYLRREKNLEGLPRCEIDNPLSYFKKLETDKIPTWQGELYFQAHRGTYTSQAKTKKGNRLCEFALRDAELWGAVSASLNGLKFPYERFMEIWRDVLLNQFHDILPGSSINRVYQEAEASYEKALSGALAITEKALGKLVKKNNESVTIFNSLSFNRKGIIELPSDFSEGAETEDGRGLPLQKNGGEIYTLVDDIPSCGWVPIRKAGKKKIALKSPLKVDKNIIENKFFRMTLNADGEISSLIDKESERDFVSAPCNKLMMYKDVPGIYDAWDIDSMYRKQPVNISSATKVKVMASGPLFAVINVSRDMNKSKISQDIIVYAESRRIDFRTSVDWQESHKMLKVDFPVNIRAEDALHEIQFGHVRRPTHDTLPYDEARFEVCNHKWTALTEEGRGAAVLNDCKYGVSVEDNSVNLTLLRSPLAPDMTADKGEQQFTYSFYCWNGPFKDSGAIQAAYELNSPLKSICGYSERKSLFSLDNPGIIIETVKPAEDRSGDIIIRLYESVRTASSCELKTELPFKKLIETDMLENSLREIKSSGGKINLGFRPFEIKTLRLVSK